MIVFMINSIKTIDLDTLWSPQTRQLFANYGRSETSPTIVGMVVFIDFTKSTLLVLFLHSQKFLNSTARF